MAITVKNLRSGEGRKCKCNGWLNHWRNFSGDKREAVPCAVIGCRNLATDGGHVQKKTGNDESWYIAPLCHDCNMKLGQELQLGDWVKLVPADKELTCEKPTTAKKG